MIVEDKRLHNKEYIFDTRVQAGEMLAKLIQKSKFDILLIIPSGGLPVGFGLLSAKDFDIIPYNLMIVRKVQVPWSTEAGMGAVTPDGQVILNDQLISHYTISNSETKGQIKQAIERIAKLRAEFGLPDIPSLENKKVLIVDDGIASGFSMKAGSQWIKKLGAAEITLAVPTAPLRSVENILPFVTKIYCLNICEGFSFAVASAYKNWYDLSITEAKEFVDNLNSLYD